MSFKIPSFRKRSADADDRDNEASHIDGERSIPSVNKGLTMQARITNFLLFGFVILLTGFLLFKYYANLYEKKKAAEDAAKVDSKSQTVSVLPPLNAPPAPPPTTTAQADNGAPPPPPNGNNGQKTDPDGKPVLSPAELLLARRQSSPVKFKVEGLSSVSGSMMQTATASGLPGTGSGNTPGINAVQVGGSPGSSDPLGDRLQGTYTPGARAALLPDRNFLIAQSAHVECTMPEALDSTLPGMVSCVQSQDIFSDNGAVKLLEKGTVYTGEMKHALALGQRRAFLLWTRAKTPNGVIIELASPSADELGRAGVTGEIDNHFLERFGNGIMLSLIEDLGAAAIASQQKSGGNGGNNTVVAFPNTVQGTQDVMTEVLKQSANIPPTLRKHQGGVVNIYVARDLDFRNVYTLKKAE
jgi:type IV secretion system protein VirB10